MGITKAHGELPRPAPGRLLSLSRCPHGRLAVLLKTVHWNRRALLGDDAASDANDPINSLFGVWSTIGIIRTMHVHAFTQTQAEWPGGVAESVHSGVGVFLFSYPVLVSFSCSGVWGRLVTNLTC